MAGNGLSSIGDSRPIETPYMRDFQQPGELQPNISLESTGY